MLQCHFNIVLLPRSAVKISWCWEQRLMTGIAFIQVDASVTTVDSAGICHRAKSTDLRIWSVLSRNDPETKQLNETSIL